MYKYQWRILLVLFLSWGTIGLARNGLAYLFPYFSVEFGLSDNHMGFLAATLAFFWSLSIMISGKLAARYGQVKVMVPGIVLGGLALFGMSFSNGVVVIYMLVALIGIGCGSICAPSLAMISEQSDPDKRGLFIGIMQSAFFLIGVAVGSVVLTKLGEVLGWRSSYVMLGIMAFVLGIILWSLRKLPQPEFTEDLGMPKTSYKEVLQNRNVLVSSVLTGVCMVWVFTVSAFAIIYLMDVRGYDAITAGVIFSGFGIGGFLGNIIVASISDYTGRKPIIMLCAVLSGVSYLTFLMIDTGAIGLTALLFFTAFCFSGLEPIVISVIPSESVPERLVATATAVTPSIGEIMGGVIAPALAGIMVGLVGIQIVMYVLSVASVIMFVGAFFLTESAPRRRDAKLDSECLIRN